MTRALAVILALVLALLGWQSWRLNNAGHTNVKTRIYAAGLTLLCLLTLSGCGTARPSPEVQLTVSGCPKVTQCRLDRSAPRSNGDLNQVLDETEAAWAVCADKVDTIIACQEQDSEQAAVLTQRPE